MVPYRSVVRHFGTLAQKNRLVFVEALFQHPHPQPFCESLCNVYLDPEFSNNEVSSWTCPLLRVDWNSTIGHWA